MDENIISWNVPNFVSVGIMAIVMFTAFGMVSQFLRSRMPSAE